MKLLRYGRPGKEKPGMLDDEGRIRDLSRLIDDITPDVLSSAVLRKLKAAKNLPIVRGKPRLGPPVGGVGKLVAIGLNYADHAKEAGQPIPKEPVVFLKPTGCIIGANDTVVLPKGAKKGDWEVELAVVIGRKAKYVSRKAALDYVAGYAIANDVSERAYQIERGGGQWTKGKACDTFAPLGPWLVTRDEVKNPQRLDLWCEVNGKRMQSGNTRTMIFAVDYLVSYLSQFMTLDAGDVIITGTPPGVGLGMKPPKFLKPGDVMRLGISGLGEQCQDVRRDA